MTRHTAKSELKRKGWSQRAAAPVLGVTFEHLNRCLNGHRHSRRLFEKITSLPVRPAPALIITSGQEVAA